jgi:dTDP-4-dehydrorhamnose 3,5-epimerase-like enzyme
MRGVKIVRIKARQDARGKVFVPIPAALLGTGAITGIHIATMRPGAVRGNHRHTRQTERICFSGRIRLVVQDSTGATEQFDFSENECVRVTVVPGIAHAYINRGAIDTFLVCAGDTAPGVDRQEPVLLV